MKGTSKWLKVSKITAVEWKLVQTGAERGLPQMFQKKIKNKHLKTLMYLNVLKGVLSPVREFRG